jgi:hypothetical protein
MAKTIGRRRMIISRNEPMRSIVAGTLVRISMDLILAGPLLVLAGGYFGHGDEPLQGCQGEQCPGDGMEL